MRLMGQGGRYVPGGSDALTGTESFINNPFTSDPVRYARNAAILEEDPTLASARRRWPGPIPRSGDARLSAAELPVRNPPADPDAGRQQRHHRLDRAIEEFAYHCAPARIS
jgi:hypothetical protein